MLCPIGSVSLGNVGSNNLVHVTGTGSTWSNLFALDIGVTGIGNVNNRLLIEDGGAVYNWDAGIGGNGAGSTNSQVVVTGSDSLWSNRNVRVGGSEGRSSLVVSNGGTVLSRNGNVGLGAASQFNQVTVTGAGSVWSNTLDLAVGYLGPGNSLVINTGGAVFAHSNLFVGAAAGSVNNRVVVNDGMLVITNISGNGLLEVRGGTNVLNAGWVEADILRLTNEIQGRFEFNGGTLSVKSSRVSAGNPIYVGNGTTPATFNLAGNGTHDFSGTLGLIVSSNSTLSGNGALIVQLQILSGATLSPGDSFGVISVSTPPFIFGDVLMEIGKNGSVTTNDQFQVAGTLTYGGSLTITNLGPDALTAGNSFQLFSASGFGGGFGSIVWPEVGDALYWTNRLAIDGTIAVVSSPNTTPTNIASIVTGDMLQLSWPAEHTGWRLEVQTNSLGLGLGTNWTDVPGSTDTHQMSFPISTAEEGVFYRLAYP